MEWQRVGETAMQCDPWTISKAFVNGRPGYELWHNGKPPMIGRYDSFSEARDAAEREANRIRQGKEND